MKKLSFVKVMIVSMILVSCGDDDETIVEIIDNGIQKTAIQFDPPESKWFYRSAPDSIVVNISGGVPPYHIETRPEFSAGAIIRGNELHVFPIRGFTTFNTDAIGSDFINISDNNESIGSFNTKVNLDLYQFTNITINELRIVGDTLVEANISDLITMRAEYDRFEKLFVVNMEVNNSTEKFRLFVDDIMQTGSYPIETNDLEYVPKRIGFNENFQIRPKVNQSINITKLSPEEINLNFDMSVQDIATSYTGTLRLVGNMTFTK